MKRPRGRPSKKWQEQLAIAIAEGRAVPIEPKNKVGCCYFVVSIETSPVYSMINSC